MNRWKRWCVVALSVAAVSTGCESDEFADAPTATASSAQGSATAEGEGSYGEAEGRSGSAGPIQGTERPPDHPTFDGEEGGAMGQGGQEQMDMPGPAVEQAAVDEYGQRGPIRWEAPSEWEPRQPSNEMRFAEYYVDSEQGSAELSVFFFGPAGAGGVDANLERWASQLQGGPEATREEREVGGMTVHTLDAAGTYHTDMPMGGGSEPQEDQRLLGAIAEASEGLFFFRFVGDEEVVSDQKEAFDQLVESLEDGG